MTEPESVYHQFCPKADRIDHGDVIETTNPLMTLTKKLDDGAGHQRTYVCSKCGMEVSVGFPPSDPVEREDALLKLKDYAQHKPTCYIYGTQPLQPGDYVGRYGECSCGLDALLGGRTPRQETEWRDMANGSALDTTLTVLWDHDMKEEADALEARCSVNCGHRLASEPPVAEPRP